MKCLLPIICMIMLLAIGGGCVPTTIGTGDGSGVGAYSYITRDVQATYNVKMDLAWPATLRAMEQLNLIIESENMDSLGGALAVKRADGTDVKIRLKSVGGYSTKISVRVGLIGSKNKSVLIHDAIRNALST